MITKIHLALSALALVASTWLTAAAAEPAPPTARLAVLDNGRVIEGEIERVGDQYRIKRPIGEMWIPAEQVQCLCGTLEEAYAFLRRQANLGDGDEHLRLARWCQQHGLRPQALAEAEEAAQLRPENPDCRRLYNSLQRAQVCSPSAAGTGAAKEPARPPPPAVEYNPEALGPFVTRVQPLLMNACASCHANDKGGSFKLVRSYEGELTNRRATQQNLAAVLAQVNHERPQSSLLLTRGVSVHGGATQAPLKGRQAPAYKLLEDWVQLALVHEPHKPAASPPPPRLPEPKSTTEAAPAKPAETFAAPTPSAPSPDPPAPPKPAPEAGPVDPFDPAIFNQQMHSGRGAPERK